MKKIPDSKTNGVLKGETTAPPQDLQSANAGSQSISDTSDTTVKAKSQTDSQLTLTSPVNAEFRLIRAISRKLGTLVEWKKVVLTDKREGWVLFFDRTKWEIVTNGKTNELAPVSKMQTGE